MGWGSGQAIKLFQATRKICFTFHFGHVSFILDDVKLAMVSKNSFEWKTNILEGGQDIIWPIQHIFRGQVHPTALDLRHTHTHTTRLSMWLCVTVCDMTWRICYTEHTQSTPNTSLDSVHLLHSAHSIYTKHLTRLSSPVTLSTLNQHQTPH